MTSAQSSSGKPRRGGLSSQKARDKRAGAGKRSGEDVKATGGAPQAHVAHASGPAGSVTRDTVAQVHRKGTRTHGDLVRHDVGVAARQVLALFIAALVVFIVLMPVSTAAIPDASIFNLDFTHDQLKWRFWATDLLPVVYACVVLYGVALGLRSFRFLLVKCETTTFLNLPLSRGTLGAVRLLVCLVALVVGIGAPLAVSLGVNIAALGVWDGIFGDFFYVWGGLVLVGAVACSVTVLCCTLAGTQVEAIAFSAALLGMVSVGAWGLGALMDYLLVGNAYGEHLYGGTVAVAPSLVQASASFNPLMFFYTEASAHSMFMVKHPVYYPGPGNGVLVGAWCAVVAAVVALAVWRLVRRPGERAGVAGLCLPLSFATGLAVGLAAFGAAFTLLASVNIPAAVVASFAAFVLVSLVLFLWPLRGARRPRTMIAVMGAEVACLAAVMVVVSTGAFGFSSYVPETDDVERVSVSYAGASDFLGERFDTAQAGSGSYYFSASYTLDDQSDIEKVTDVHGRLSKTGHAAWETDRKDFGNTVVPYDVKIDYTLKDGSEVVRYYDCATLDELYSLASLDASDKVRSLERATVTGDVSELSEDDAAGLSYSSAHQAYVVGDVYLCDAYYAAPVKVNCSGDARNQLLMALAQDASAQSTEDRYHPASTARGVLMFSQSGQSDAQTFAYSLSNNVIYLTDEYTHTLAWLEENGLSEYLHQADSSVIESLTFQRYDPYAGMNAVTAPQSALFKGYRSNVNSNFVVMQDFGTKYTTTDPAELQQLVPLLRNQYFMDTGGYLVCAKLSGVDAYAYFFLPDSDVPEWLLRVAG